MLAITYNAQYCPKRHKAARRAHVAAFGRLAALHPVAIAVNEAGGYRKELRHVGGYRVIQPRGYAGKNALLIRDDVKVHESGVHKLHGRKFVGRDVAGARRTGWTSARGILWALITDPDAGNLVYVAAWHTVPSQSHSERARALLADEASAAAAWVRSLAHPSVLSGDTNGDPKLPLFAPLRAVATAAFAVSRGKARIDGHWIADGDGKAAALSGYSSDHKPVVADITWTAKPKPAPKEKPVSKNARFIPSPPFIAARWHGGRQRPKSIVIHGTVSPCQRGGARAVAGFFAREAGKTSAHYIVDPGEVVQCVGDHTIAYHCGYNTGSIAVELCDPQTGPNSRWGDKAHRDMLALAEELVARLCLSYGIEAAHVTVKALKAKGPHGIYSHNQSRLAFGHTTHTDPGPGFPWKAFVKGVRAEMARLQGKATDAPSPVPAPKPAPKPDPQPAPRPYHEAQAIDEARTVVRNAAKHGHKHRASKWRSILDTMLGRK